MANYNFTLRNKNSTTATPIYLVIRWNNLKLVYPTFEKILPTYWNFVKQKADKKNFPEQSEFNYRLEKINTDSKRIFLKFKNDNENQEPTKPELKSELDKVFKRSKSIKFTLYSFIESFIVKSSAQKKPLTITQYKNTVSHLKSYSEKLDFKSITLDFYYDFTAFLLNDKQLSPNTVGKIIKTLKTFLNEATEREINTNLAFRSRKFKKYEQPTEKIYLTDADVDKLYNLDLSNNKKLDTTRDLFIIGCYTALRSSDYTQIQPEYITKRGSQLKIKTFKTGEIVVIPLHYRVKEILKKYDNSLPGAISNQWTNKYLKEIGKLAKINEIIIKTEQKGKLRIDKKVKKYELITTHAARRSGATNMFLADIKPINIMKITGHKTEKSFMRYIRITAEENADLLMSNKFFNAPLKKVN